MSHVWCLVMTESIPGVHLINSLIFSLSFRIPEMVDWVNPFSCAMIFTFFPVMHFDDLHLQIKIDGFHLLLASLAEVEHFFIPFEVITSQNKSLLNKSTVYI